MVIKEALQLTEQKHQPTSQPDPRHERLPKNVLSNIPNRPSSTSYSWHCSRAGIRQRTLRHVINSRRQRTSSSSTQSTSCCRSISTLWLRLVDSISLEKWARTEGARTVLPRGAPPRTAGPPRALTRISITHRVHDLLFLAPSLPSQVHLNVRRVGSLSVPRDLSIATHKSLLNFFLQRSFRETIFSAKKDYTIATLSLIFLRNDNYKVECHNNN